jgi:DNA-directed RNA polymerase specialized sigma subunit
MKTGTQVPPVDVQARNELVLRHIGLVPHLVMAKYGGKGSHVLDDMIQDGYLGLIRAAEKFDPSKGRKFSTYLDYWVRHFVNEGKMSRKFITVPKWSYQIAVRYIKAADAMGDQDFKHEDIMRQIGAKEKHWGMVMMAVLAISCDHTGDSDVIDLYYTEDKEPDE